MKIDDEFTSEDRVEEMAFTRSKKFGNLQFRRHTFAATFLPGHAFPDIKTDKEPILQTKEL